MPQKKESHLMTLLFFTCFPKVRYQRIKKGAVPPNQLQVSPSSGQGRFYIKAS